MDTVRRAKLRDTVWNNYQLTTIQWLDSPDREIFSNPEIPRPLTNVTPQTYDHGGTLLVHRILRGSETASTMQERETSKPLEGKSRFPSKGQFT